jgi:hypothetical protein
MVSSPLRLPCALACTDVLLVTIGREDDSSICNSATIDGLVLQDKEAGKKDDKHFSRGGNQFPSRQMRCFG